MGLFDKLASGLRKTAEQISRGFGEILRPGVRLSPEILAELEEALILSDVGVVTARDVLKKMQDRLAGEPSGNPRNILRQCLRERLEWTGPLAVPLPDSVAVFMVGVNGVGKTTTAGKLAAQWALEGRKVLLAAGDTFRAAAEEQLTEWAKRAKVKVLRGDHQAAPSAVVFDALKSGVSQGFERLVVDTAGRLHNRVNLMDELKKVLRTADKAAPGLPVEKWLVLDASTGQNAISQAREFDAAIGLTGIVLTKLDGTAKGGVAVALADLVKVPIRYVGVGEGLEDLLPFDSERFAEALIP
jgi:fused signal recognition particle receptor